MPKTTRPQWYIQLNGIEEGPITSQTLRSLAEAGRIYPDTPIRKEGMTKTVQASKIKGLLNQNIQAPIINAQVSPVVDIAPGITLTSEKSLPKVRPWVRYWARMFDITLFSLAAGFLIVYFAPNAFSEPGSEQFLGIFILFIWAFIEASLLSTFGITPGNLLFRIKFVLTSGSKFSYSEALTRSLKVWWRGLGTGFPLISIVTMLVAHNRLINNQQTSWDREGGFIINHEKIGILRILVAVAFFIVFLGLISISNAING
jgi:hypothetical protein